MSKHLFFKMYPPHGLAEREKMGYNEQNCGKEACAVEKQMNMQAGCGHAHIHENQKAVVNRLARAIGHLEKVKRMVEGGSDCTEVLVQLAAVRSAIDNTGKVILQEHMRHCMTDAVASGDEDAVEDLCRAIERYMK